MLINNAGISMRALFEDADLDRVLDGTVLSAFGSNGEACMAGSRILVARGLYDRFVSEFVERASSIRFGDPLSEATEL